MNINKSMSNSQHSSYKDNDKYKRNNEERK